MSLGRGSASLLYMQIWGQKSNLTKLTILIYVIFAVMGMYRV